MRRVIARMFREFWLNTLVASPILPVKVRAAGLRLGGLRLGQSVKIAPGNRFVSGYEVVFGDQVYVNTGCVFDGSAPIVLEQGVRVGPGVQFLTSSHEISADPAMRAGFPILGGITVGRGSWVGAAVTVLPGVTIAPGCVVGAGAVVTGDTEADGLYLGVPARRVKSLPGRSGDRQPVLGG